MQISSTFRISLISVWIGIAGCSSFLKSTHTLFPAGSPSTCGPKGIGGADPAAPLRSLILSSQDAATLSGLITKGNVVAVGAPEAATNPRELYRGLGDAAGESAAAAASARNALNVLTSPTHQKLLAVIALGTIPSTRGLPNGVAKVLEQTADGEPTLVIDRQEWVEYSGLVAEVSLSDGWTALSVASENVADSPSTSAYVRGISSAIGKESDFISKYVAAYFRQGHLLALTLSPSTLEGDVKTRINNYATGGGATAAQPTVDATADEVLGELLPSGCKKTAAGTWPATCNVLGSVGDTGFVSRAGDKYAFPALNFVADPLGQQKLQKPQVDLSKVGADLVRVLVEATGDSLARVPAVQGSTGCTSGLLECFDPSAGHMSADNFGKVTQYGAMSEAVAGQAIGALVRGGFFFALNNEALAQSIETGVSVAARKSAEKVAWDYLSCTASTKEFRTIAVNAVGYRQVAISVK